MNGCNNLMGMLISKIGSILAPIFIIGLIIYIGFFTFLYFFQSRLIYFPERTFFTTPDILQLSHEDIYFNTSDNIRLFAWYIPAAHATDVLIFCHGNAGNISHRMESIKIFHELGLNVFIFDYRGYGRSEGKPSEQGTYRDAEAAWNFLVSEKGVNPKNIFIFGRSLGGAIASWLAKQHTPRALIIESAFTSVVDVAAKFYPLFPVNHFLRFKYPTKEFIEKIDCPVLIIHSRDDEIIPFQFGQELYQIANEPKQFLEIHGSHNDGFYISGDSYFQTLKEFFARQHANGTINALE